MRGVWEIMMIMVDEADERGELSAVGEMNTMNAKGERGELVRVWVLQGGIVDVDERIDEENNVVFCWIVFCWIVFCWRHRLSK